MSVSHNLVHGFTTNFSGVTPDADNVTTNPRFTNAATGDYTLAMGSPAINAGLSLVGFADADIAGIPRPTKLRWEIGAYESTLEGASLRILQWTGKKVRSTFIAAAASMGTQHCFRLRLDPAFQAAVNRLCPNDCPVHPSPSEHWRHARSQCAN